MSASKVGFIRPSTETDPECAIGALAVLATVGGQRFVDIELRPDGSFSAPNESLDLLVLCVRNTHRINSSMFSSISTKEVFITGLSVKAPETDEEMDGWEAQEKKILSSYSSLTDLLPGAKFHVLADKMYGNGWVGVVRWIVSKVFGTEFTPDISLALKLASGESDVPSAFTDAFVGRLALSNVINRLGNGNGYRGIRSLFDMTGLEEEVKKELGGVYRECEVAHNSVVRSVQLASWGGVPGFVMYTDESSAEYKERAMAEFVSKVHKQATESGQGLKPQFGAVVSVLGTQEGVVTRYMVVFPGSGNDLYYHQALLDAALAARPTHYATNMALNVNRFTFNGLYIPTKANNIDLVLPLVPKDDKKQGEQETGEEQS